MRKENEGFRLRREKGRAGLTPAIAAVVVGVVVVGVAAVGYVVLSALSGSGTQSSSVHSCYPASAPPCAGKANSTSTGFDSAGAAGVPIG